jgi:hypothetical protein
LGELCCWVKRCFPIDCTEYVEDKNYYSIKAEEVFQFVRGLQRADIIDWGLSQGNNCLVRIAPRTYLFTNPKDWKVVFKLGGVGKYATIYTKFSSKNSIIRIVKEDCSG